MAHSTHAPAAPAGPAAHTAHSPAAPAGPAAHTRVGRNRTGLRAVDRRSPIGRSCPDVQLSGPGAERIAEIAGSVPDPELPMVTLANLGVLRAVDVDPDTEHVTVTITPTYSGCPAVAMMSTDVETLLARAGHTDVTVQRTLTHAWSSDDMTTSAHEALRESGIAPPAHRAADAPSYPICPQCASAHVEQLSRFGSTSCKALFRCLDCREPFDYFKVL